TEGEKRHPEVKPVKPGVGRGAGDAEHGREREERDVHPVFFANFFDDSTSGQLEPRSMTFRGRFENRLSSDRIRCHRVAAIPRLAIARGTGTSARTEGDGRSAADGESGSFVHAWARHQGGARQR